MIFYIYNTFCRQRDSLRIIRRKFEDVRLRNLVANTRQSLSRVSSAGLIDADEYLDYEKCIIYAEKRENG